MTSSPCRAGHRRVVGLEHADGADVDPGDHATDGALAEEPGERLDLRQLRHWSSVHITRPSPQRVITQQIMHLRVWHDPRMQSRGLPPRTASAPAWSPRASRPAMTPSTSASERFWLSLALASIRPDPQLDADDRPQLTGDEARRGRRPPTRVRHRASCLVGEPPDEFLDPRRIVVDDEPPVDVGGDVVPGRDDPAVLALARVPARGHVGVRAADDHQRSPSGRRHWSLFRATWPRSAPCSPASGSWTNGSIVASSPSARRGDEVGGAVVVQQVADGLVVHAEVRGHVHALSIAPPSPPFILLNQSDQANVSGPICMISVGDGVGQRTRRSSRR